MRARNVIIAIKKYALAWRTRTARFGPFGSGKRKTSPSSPPAQTRQHSTEERLGKGRCDVCFYTFKSNDVVGIYKYDQLKQMCTSTLVGCLGCGGLRICKGCAPTYKHDLLKPPQGPAVKKQRLSL